MSIFDKVMHFLGAAAAGLVSILAATDTHAPKAVTIGAAVVAYATGALAKSLKPEPKK